MRISTAKYQTNCRCLLLMCPTCFQLEYLTPNMYLSTVSENQLHICFISLKSGRYDYVCNNNVFRFYLYTLCLLHFWCNWESFVVPYIFLFFLFSSQRYNECSQKHEEKHVCLKFPEEASLLCFTEELFCGARDETKAVPNVVTVCEKFAVSLS